MFMAQVKRINEPGAKKEQVLCEIRELLGFEYS
jgi:hypothetical protein